MPEKISTCNFQHPIVYTKLVLIQTLSQYSKKTTFVELKCWLKA